jgi:hypothetical protein
MHDRVVVEADSIIGIITTAEYDIARYIGFPVKLKVKLLYPISTLRSLFLTLLTNKLLGLEQSLYCMRFFLATQASDSGLQGNLFEVLCKSDALKSFSVWVLEH